MEQINVEWKTEGVVDSKSENRDCDEVIYVQDEVNQEEN